MEVTWKYGLVSTPRRHKSRPQWKILWMPLWWIWSPPRSREGWCCTCHAHTNQHHRASRVPCHGNLPQPLHSWSFHPDCSPAWATQKGCRIQLGCFLSYSFSACKECCCEWHYPSILWCIMPNNIQVDASQVRLRAALLQDNKPVAFVSRALTEVEHCYANIECEMLAVVFGAERFRTYVYGRPFTIESDHKPLESMTKKSLAHMTAWLQCLLLHLQRYDYVLCYHSEKEMALPDTLSRFKPKPGLKIALDIAIHHAHLSPVQREALQLAFWDGCWDPCPSWYHHLWLAWWHQGSPTSTTSLPPTLWITQHWWWTCVLQRSPHHLSIRKGGGPWYPAPITSRQHQKNSCLPMIVYSGLVSTRPLRKLFGNMKHAWYFKPRMPPHH